jgi:hypothetical protein
MLSMIFLNDDDRIQLRAQHRRERDGRVRDRIKAVLLYDKGWSIAAIAEALLLSEENESTLTGKIISPINFSMRAFA